MRNIIIRSSNLSSAYNKARDAVDRIDRAGKDITNFKSDAEDYSANWVEKYYVKHINKPYCSVNRSDSKYWKTVYDSEGNAYQEFRKALYDQDAIEAAKRWVRAQRNQYLALRRNLSAKVPDCLARMKAIKTALYRLDEIKNEFNETPINIEEAYSLVSNNAVMDDFVWNTESYLDNVTGEKVEYKVLYQIDKKNNLKLTINEAVNCAITNLGACSDNVVAIASSLALGKIDDAEVEAALNKMVKDTGALMGDYLKRGFFGVTTTVGIEALYTEATGLDYDFETVRTDYNSICSYYLKDAEEQGDYLTSLVSAGCVGTFGMAAVIGKEINEQGTMSIEDKKAAGLEKYTKKKKENKPEEKDKKDENIDVTVLEYGTSGTTNVRNIVKTEYASATPLKVQGISETNGPHIISRDMEGIMDSRHDGPLEVVTDREIPDKIEETVIGSDDIDREMGENYLRDYTEKEMTDSRGKLLEDYNRMSTQERVSSLQKLGYRDDVISEIVNNGAAGVTAYVIGEQNRQMANIASQVATQQAGNYDITYRNGSTGIDSGVNYTNVQNVRRNFDGAQVSYSNAITNANNAIDDANKARDEYNKKVASIKRHSGDDPSNWTEEEIEEYNLVTSRYNEAVEVANRAADVVLKERDNYEGQRHGYESAKEDMATITQEEVARNLSEEKPETRVQTLVGVDENGELVSETRVYNS